MILETLPEIQKLSPEQKAELANDLLDDLNAPPAAAERDAAILDVLNERFEAWQENPESGSNWDTVKARLQGQTGASWRK